ncbi:hypothetical protein C5167_032870 [Papaver somniferum]|uniref:Uncharacterized protein n=1 Tax=Papaver somniferum TaxID=3469 RepID=A0A4Y7KBM0_PAPSO|nr:hypothetical protein C5167_032870 [Papaver somniferum]
MFRLDVILQLRIVDLGLMLKLFLTRASALAHRRVKESHLSSDAIFRQSHAGLFNLCIGVLVAVKISLITENLMKLYITKRLTTFHVLVCIYSLSHAYFEVTTSLELPDMNIIEPCLSEFNLSLPLFAVASYMVEKIAQNKLVLEPVAPYSIFYSLMEEHLSQVGVDTTNNKWNETLVLGVVDPNDSLSHPAGVFDVQVNSATCLASDHFANFLISLVGILRRAQGCVVLDKDGFTAKKQTHFFDIVRRLQRRS